ncbi:MAG: AAA family ATPase [Proteobacteria bacterium]|nr:AAA family ATPase [Pseudomonadota bacterium]
MAPPIIAVANRKGGQGKTTVSVNLAAAFAEEGLRVLVLDMDSQANATRALVLGPLQGRGTTAHVIAGQVGLADIVIPSNREGIVLAPGHHELTGALMSIVGKIGRELILKREFATVTGFDVAIIDTPPEQQLGLVNSLVAASHILLPFTPDPNALEGMQTTMDAAAEIRAAGIASPSVLGCVQIAYDKRLVVTMEARNAVAERFGDLLFESVIRTNSNFLPCPAWNMDIFRYEEEHGRTIRGSEDFRSFAREALGRLGLSGTTKIAA